MPNQNNHQVSQYLTNCFYTINKGAQEEAAAFYENHPLHLLPPMERFAELGMLSAKYDEQFEAFDRPEYLRKGQEPQFLIRHFARGNCYFSEIENIKYKQAMLLLERRKLNDRLLAITGIRIEMERVEISRAESAGRGEQPDTALDDHLHYLQSQLQLLLSHDPQQPADSQGKAKRGPSKKCAFGLQIDEELFHRMVDDLNKALGFLKSPTTTDDFIKVVTAPVPAMVGIPIYFKCNNKQLMYIMNYLKTIFLSFEAATIGNAGLFFSKEGHLLTAHNLNSTICDHVEKRYSIDKVFKKYGIGKPQERLIRTATNKQERVNALPVVGGY